MHAPFRAVAMCLLACAALGACSRSEAESPQATTPPAPPLPDVDIDLEAFGAMLETWELEHGEAAGSLGSLSRHQIENWLTDEARARVEAEVAFLDEHRALLDAVTAFALAMEQPIVISFANSKEVTDSDGAMAVVRAIAGNRHLIRLLSEDAAHAHAEQDHERSMRRCAAMIAIASIRQAEPDPIFCYLQAAILRMGIATAREEGLFDLGSVSAEQVKLMLNVTAPFATDDPVGVIDATEKDDTFGQAPRQMRHDAMERARDIARQLAAVVTGFRTELEALAETADNDD